MTLGGLALAVGILVDDATVEIENTHRNMAMRKPLVRAVLDGAQQIAAPAFVSTLSICIVFVPVLLLTGAAKYLFTPLAMAVVFAMMASYLLSRTLIPTMVHYLLQPEVKLYAHGEHGEAEGGKGLIWRAHYLFNRRFELMRASYTSLLHWCLDHRCRCWRGSRSSWRARWRWPGWIGTRFLPDRGFRARCACTRGLLRARASKRPRQIFADIENEIRAGDSGARDRHHHRQHRHSQRRLQPGIRRQPDPRRERRRHSDLAERPRSTAPPPNTPTSLRKRLHEKFPDVVFFFEAANITNQILNFGLPAPIDVQVVGRNAAANYEIARQICGSSIERIPGAADVHIHQVVDYPEIRVNVDRSKAGQVGLTQRDVTTQPADLAERAAGQISPTQWLDWSTGVSYFVHVQTPQYRIDSLRR